MRLVCGRALTALVASCCLVYPQTARAQFGVVMPGAGAENRAMGGASTAAPVSPAGSIYWNPASITGLAGSQVEIDVEALWPHEKLSSTLPANAFGKGSPKTTLADTTRSDNDAFWLPTGAVVWQPEGSSVVYGLGFFSAGEFGVNFPASKTNPVLTPQPPKGFGLGPIYSRFQLYQIVPTFAVQYSDELSFGVAPTLSLATLSLNPALLATPDDANHDGTPTYPAATGGPVEAGGGVQVGLFYALDWGLSFGASFKSPQWMQTFHYQTADELGHPRGAEIHLNYPLMASAGIGFTGLSDWVFAADIHYINYSSTPGFDHGGFGPTGAVTGLGWDDVLVGAFGVEYTVIENLTLMGGYAYCTSPIPGEDTMFNLATPLIPKHTLSFGVMYNLCDEFRVTFAYIHAFEESLDGPFTTLKRGGIRNSDVQITDSSDSFVLGATLKF
jgi:long-chain fatty acid transport protein